MPGCPSAYVPLSLYLINHVRWEGGVRRGEREGVEGGGQCLLVIEEERIISALTIIGAIHRCVNGGPASQTVARH